MMIRFDIPTPLTVRFKFWNLVPEQNICVELHLFTPGRECIFDIDSYVRPKFPFRIRQVATENMHH